ncbi:glycoside hydrolase family 3 protein [Cellvibrio polysaccharolyticus]|uniref:Glycoside hydrolase family 3 protein n=1 Tax=Cellvibrio polysaccharolyticus TaxID=2082724 RepID=A0A928V715_9GAMM|nr:glycoside hydrolase family 3 N-terminal domain-containing protein [Cellvibrio polysaccharolyticus]MBE8718101.1 glycoside hydrolase family 3 protein [Cellvibrio polysaccharolyticus]
MRENSIFRRSLLACTVFAILAGCDSSPKDAANNTSSADQASSAVESSKVEWPVIKSAIPQDAAVEARIDELLARMTVEEKVGQMIQPEIKQATAEDVKKYHLGSVLNGGGTTPNNDKYAKLSDWVALADSYWHASVDKTDGRAGIPIIWGTDAVHGLGNVVGATLFPHNIALGATHNPELLKKIGEVTAREIAATGLDWNFSPTVAVARDDRWGRTYEAWSEDPEVVGAYAGEMVKGLQGVYGTDEYFTDRHVIATAKHFIGDGGTLDGVDRGETQGDEKVLRDIHGAGYFTGIEAGVQVVMASFTSWQGTRMHGHEYLLTNVLKERMGFDGFVVGDWSGHGFIPGCTALDCPQAINAGLDIFMVPEPEWKTLFHNTVEQVNSGVISAQRLDDAVRRILRVKIRAGLFERGAPSTRSLAGREDVLGSAEHRAVALQAVRESLVLLKNKNGLLPLSRNSNVLVTGDGADNIGKQAGGWSVSWQGTGNTNTDFPGGTSIYAGINKVVSEAGGQVELSEDGSFKNKPDVAIVVFGEDPYAEMQGDVANLAYKPRDQRDWELLKSLQAQGIPVVSLFITGRPLWVNREINASDAFVSIWQPGTEGQGIADVIFRNAEGEVNHDMKGRLTFSWPTRPDQFLLNRGDADYQPLFPYGFGLSYQDKDTLGDDLSEEGIALGETVEVLEIFNRRPIAPWDIEIIGFQNDREVMSSNTLSLSSLSIEAVDRNEQQDARRVVWNGKGVGQVALGTANRQDFLSYAQEKSALIFDIKVNRAPTDKTLFRLGCGSYCASDLDFTEKLTALAGKEWQTISIDLTCFPNAGANFGVTQPPEEFLTQVLQPFSLLTSGELDITFARVRLERGAATGQCQ